MDYTFYRYSQVRKHIKVKSLSNSFFFISLILFGFTSGYAQSWTNLGEGTDDIVRCFYYDSTSNKLIVGGNFKYADNLLVNGIATWDGSEWDSLGNGLDIVTSICTYANSIYCGGTGGIFKFNGTTWNNIAPDGNVFSFDGTLYACGWFDSIGGVPASKIAKYDGLTWSVIDTTKWYGGAINEVELYNNELYIGGNFTNYNGTIQRIARWNGQNWIPLGQGIRGSTSSVNCLSVYKNKLYVGGYFLKTNNNPGNHIASWNGNTWSDLGNGMAPSNGQVFDLFPFNNYLFAVGAFTTSGGIPSQFISKWDDSNWCGMNSSFNNIILAMGALNDTLYIGGGFVKNYSDTLNYIARLSSDFINDTCSQLNEVKSLDIKDNVFRLYPNPATNHVTIEISGISELVDIYIRDLTGKELIKTKGHSPSTLSLDHFRKGVYLLSVNTSKGLFNRIFVIQ